MPIKAQKQFTSWSFSRWHDYRTCPLKAKLKHLDKVPEPQGPALARGEKIDALATKFTTAPKVGKLPAELARFPAEFAELRKIRTELVVQQKWAFDRDWKLCSPTDWNRAWLRTTLDVGHIGQEIGRVIDWKTGKIYPYHADQLELYAPATLLFAAQSLGRKLKSIRTELWYLDQGEIDDRKGVPFLATEAEKLIKTWEKRVKPMFTDQAFKPRPNEGCRYCHFRKSNGGPCPV